MSPLPKYGRTPIQSEGERAKRKKLPRAIAYGFVSRRAQGRCEMPTSDGGRCNRAQNPLDPHHVFGRGHLGGISEEVCEDPTLILGACRRCHDRVHDGDVALGDRARTKAVAWFAEAHGLPYTPGGNPLDEMRELVRLMGEAA